MSDALHRQGFQNRLLFRSLPDEAAGGSSWIGERAGSGDGIGSAITTKQTTFTGYAVEVGLPETTTRDTPEFQPVARWELIADADQDIERLDLIRNEADPQLVFQVMTVDRELGYIVCELVPAHE